MVGKNNRHFNLKNIELTLKQKIALILGLSMFLTVALSLSSKMKDNSVVSVARPAAGEMKEVELDAYEAGSEEPVHLNLKIDPKSYSKEDAEKILGETKERLGEIIKADNESLDNVTGKLNLASVITEYGINAEWISSDFQTIGYDGEVYNSEFDEDETRQVTLLAKLTLGESEATKSFDVTVAAPGISEEERSRVRIRDAVNEAQANEATSDIFFLPGEVDGREVKFTKPDDSVAPGVFLLLGIIGAVGVLIGEKKKKERMQKERADALLGDYPGIISKLSLFFGAGMTIFNAFIVCRHRAVDIDITRIKINVRHR